MKQSKMWIAVAMVLSVFLTQVVVATTFANPASRLPSPQTLYKTNQLFNVTLEGNQIGANLGQKMSPAGDINGDGYGEVIITAPTFDNGQTDEGAAFIYYGSANGLVLPPATALEMNQAGAQMGGAAAGGDINGDGYADVLVSAPLFSNGQTNEGAVFVYHGSPAGITITPTLALEQNQASGRFGHALAFVGDVNGDGYGDVLVGATTFDNGQTDEGVAFLYYGSSSGLNGTPLQLERNQAAAEFGHVVAGLGDVNGDGYADAAVSGRLFDNGQTDEGAVFIYYGSGTGLPTTPSLTLEQNQASAQLGHSLAPAGDVNGDGYSDVLVGANLYDNGQTNEGAVFVYHGSAGGVVSTPAVTLERNQASAQFGAAVAGLADINGDGYSDIVAGASAFTNGQTSEGATFVYYGSATGIPTTPAVTVESNQANAGLGAAAAPAGDVNGDGYSDYLTAAPLYDNGETDEGQAYLTYGTAVGLSTQEGWSFAGVQASANLGSDVAGIGDVNGDGYDDLAVGAWRYDNGQTDEGRVYIFHGSATGFSSTPNLVLESNQTNAFLGVRLGGANDLNGDGYDDVAIGAYRYDNGQTDEGVVFVYYGSPTGLNPASVVLLQSNVASSDFGHGTTGAGDINGDGFGDLIVGALTYNSRGAIFVYYGSPTGVSTTPSAILTTSQLNAQLGVVVNSAGDLNGDGFADIVGGANVYDNGQTNEGALFVYYGSQAGIVITPTIIESNLASSALGISVASTDINKDGYSDLVAGAAGYSNGQSDEGALWVYHGSPAGVVVTPTIIIEINQAVANFGVSVDSSGDINQDGYGDVIVGARYYDNGQADEGGAFVYYGSETTLSNTPALILEKNVAGTQFGISLAGLGDVNGDGLADIAVGAWGFDGTLYVYYGNQNRRGRAALREQLTEDGSQRVSPWGSPQSFEQFVVEQQITSPTGRQRVKLQVEVCPTGIPFGDNTCTTYTSPTWADITATSSGITLTLPITNLGSDTLYRWRSRVLYVPYTSTAAGITPPPNPIHTPWQRPTAQAHEADIRTAPRPDVAITKTATPPIALPGEPITYTLTFTNSGSALAHNVVITDLIPAEFISVTYQSSGAVITPTGTMDLVWLVQDLPPGEGGQITVTGWLTTPLPAGWVIINTALITTTDDEISENNQATAVITIENAVLVAIDDLFTVPEDSVNNLLDVLANDSDDNGDVLFLSVLGTPNQGGTVTISGTEVEYTPLANFFGTEVFTYTAGDGNGGFDTAVVTVTVTPVNDDPQSLDDTYTVAEDSINNLLDVLANDSDVESTLSLTSLGTPNQGGTVTISGTEVEYTPLANFFGTEVFTYTAGDGNGGFDTAVVTVTVTPVNDDPQSLDDTYVVAQASVNNLFNVLANDAIAPDSGETLTLTEIGSLNQGGTAVISSNQVAYTPLPAFTGQEVFTYTASDGNGGFATATVTVTVVTDQAPYFVSTPITTAQTNVAYSYEVVTDDPDVTDVLTITAELLPNWLSLTDFGDRTGELTGTPPAAGVYPVTLVVSDGILSATQQFTITVEEGITPTYRLYLPVIMRPYAFQLGEAYPSQPVTEQGVIYYANTITLPAELPTGGAFYLSSTSNGLGRVIVDDSLTIMVGGQVIFTQGFGQPPAGLIVPLAPEIVAQMAGQEVTIYYQDVFGDQQAATAVWLIWVP